MPVNAARYGVDPLTMIQISSTSGISVGQFAFSDALQVAASPRRVSPRSPRCLASKCTCMNTPKKCMNAGTIAAMMIVWYGRFRNSIIRNAAAPMIGGVICPPVDDAASTAPAKCARVAEADHRGNRQRADRHRVGDRGAGQHAEHRGGEHAHLGRAARVAAGDRRRDVDEELAQADARGQHAEQHEVEDVGRDHAHRDAVDALAGEVEVVDEIRPRRAGVLQQARKDRARRARRP